MDQLIKEIKENITKITYMDSKQDSYIFWGSMNPIKGPEGFYHNEYSNHYGKLCDKKCISAVTTEFLENIKENRPEYTFNEETFTKCIIKKTPTNIESWCLDKFGKHLSHEYKETSIDKKYMSIKKNKYRLLYANSHSAYNF